MKRIIWLAFYIASFSLVNAQNSPKKIASVVPTRLTCEYLPHPQGLDVKQPRLGWILTAVDSTAYEQAQSAYRILVSSATHLMSKGVADQWDSGWVHSSDMQHIVYGGKPLDGDRAYFWKVQVKDENGRVSAWSPVSKWTTGLFEQSAWTSQWIGGNEMYDIKAEDNNIQDPWFRKTFELDAKPGQALFYLASVGYHEVYVNGLRVGDDVLMPAATDHTKRARYVTYDIAEKLKKGKNVIAVWLGTSWSIFPPYVLEASHRPLTPIFIAQVDMYKNANLGKNNIPMLSIGTDGSWKTYPSPNRLLGKWDFRKMGGEIWDARKEVPDWNRVECDESRWKAAVVYHPRLNLSAQKVEGNRLFEEIRPIRIESREDGSYRVDMGVNFAGWTQVNIQGKEGDTVRFEYSERIQDDMTFNLHSAYVIGPKGKGIFRNRFNYSSGRWITIRGLKEAPALTDIKGWMIRTNFSNVTSFESSDTLQNWIHDRMRWTFENLSLGGYIVDCPQRERMGYGGDAHATSETGMFNYQLGAFYTKWMEDWRDVQGVEPMVGNMLDTAHARKKISSGRILGGGVLPHTAPTYFGAGGPAWGGIVVTLPWFMYQHYGDKRALEENFDLMRAWLSFLESETENNLLKRFGGKEDFLGDWLWPNATAEGLNNDKPETLCLNNAYYVFNLRTASKVAKALNREQEALKWENQATKTADAVRNKFYITADSSYADGSMAVLAAVLLADIPSVDERPQVFDRLAREIMEVRKGHIHAGITGGALLFKLLREEGRNDLIYSMVSKRTYPSWGYMKANDATTIWEMWEKDLAGHSLLHSSYLYPGAWYIDGLAGIRRSQDVIGFKQFIIRPPSSRATDVQWVRAAFDAPVGTIRSQWSRSAGQLELRVSVPPNSTGIVQVSPDEELMTEHLPFLKGKKIKDGLLQYELPAGHYHLTQKK